jgi:hypothetical protein
MLHYIQQPLSFTKYLLDNTIVLIYEIIYCLFSDGAGRSGVYLAIDANIELSEEDGVFDVYGYLKKMRLQRRGLIETMVSRT